MYAIFKPSRAANAYDRGLRRLCRFIIGASVSHLHIMLE
jgi:hypothetical protein